jgi:S-DNA-T family DNA segregation ATPase FtsK/SpoIIIE
VNVSDLPAADVDGRPWRIPIGVSEADLRPAALVVYPGEHALVAGPARSGKTTTLATIAAVTRAARPDLAVVTIGPARSPLPGLIDPDEHLTPDRLDELVGVITGVTADRPALLLVDDADTVDDPTSVINGLLAVDRPGLLVVAAGRAETLRGSFSHWTRTLRRSKLGLLLRPNLDLDGDLLGINLPRRLPVAMTTGRGILVNGGDLELVQVALR